MGAEVVWARGGASDSLIGHYSEAANWDSGAVPGPEDRARVDRGGTVNEPGQTFNFTSNADVALDANYFVAFNRGNVAATLAPGSTLTIGGSLILGQDDNPGNDGEDITVKLDGAAQINGGIILGLRYNGDVSDVNLLVEITGSVRADDILVANEVAQGGDRASFLDPARNNSAAVKIGTAGRLTLIGNKIARANQLVADGTLVAVTPETSLDIDFDGTDTRITAAVAAVFEPE